MKVVGYTIIHYGKDYIGYAVRSVLPLVDKHNIFFTPHPSHGTKTDIPPIENQSQIMAAVSADPKIQWYHMSGIYQEGIQRDTALQKCVEDGADLVLVVDCDEVWHVDVLAAAIEAAATSGRRDNLINFTHLWRSFNWACHDQGWPVRLINPHYPQSATPYYLSDIGQIYHFGYAVTDKVLQYKMNIHGHKGEFRPDWYDTKWKIWEPGINDVHPTNDKDFWMPKLFSKHQLPDLMKAHPFWDLEIIE